MDQPSVMAAYRDAQARVAREPGNGTALFNLGWAASRAGAFDAAILAYEQTLSLSIPEPEEAMYNLAVIYSEHLGKLDSAHLWLARARAANGDYFPAVFHYAHLLEQVGDRQGAVAAFRRAADLRPDDALPVARWVEALTGQEQDSVAAQRLEKFAERGDPDALFALAKHEEQKGRFDSAWARLEAANRLDATGRPPWPAAAIAQRVMRELEQPISDVSDGSGPIFIVGMFRTGSTLLEQILAAHPRFSPLGESDFWPRQIARMGGRMVIPGQQPRAGDIPALRQSFEAMINSRAITPGTRPTDKRPDNLFHIATLAWVIPEARFIITERDWRDTLISVFGTRLHPQHGYATSVALIREHLRLCGVLAARWEKVSPERITRVRYEDLIQAPEATLKSLLGWLGESWDPACLNFHKLDNPVRTASVWQIRQPLSSARRGRWRNYAEQLRSVLGPDLDSDTP